MLNEGLETLVSEWCNPLFEKSGLEEITFPGTLREVHALPLDECSKLRRIWIGDGCNTDCLGGARCSAKILPAKRTMIGNTPLWGLRQLRHVGLPEGISRIGSYWFNESKIKSVAVAASVRKIEEGAFMRCGKLAKVEFARNSQLQTIGEYAFYESGLEEFLAPKALKMIGDDAFKNCTRLKWLVLNAGLDALGSFAFAFSGLESAQLPSTLKSLSAGTFAQCKNLKDVRLPRGLEHIGMYCFYDSGIEEIRLPDTLRSIADDAFENCHALKTVFAAESCATDVRNSAGSSAVVLLK